jgi:hypothetical protein
MSVIRLVFLEKSLYKIRIGNRIGTRCPTAHHPSVIQADPSRSEGCPIIEEKGKGITRRMKSWMGIIVVRGSGILVEDMRGIGMM